MGVSTTVGHQAVNEARRTTQTKAVRNEVLLSEFSMSMVAVSRNTEGNTTRITMPESQCISESALMCHSATPPPKCNFISWNVPPPNYVPKLGRSRIGWEPRKIRLPSPPSQNSIYADTHSDFTKCAQPQQVESAHCKGALFPPFM